MCHRMVGERARMIGEAGRPHKRERTLLPIDTLPLVLCSSFAPAVDGSYKAFLPVDRRDVAQPRVGRDL